MAFLQTHKGPLFKEREVGFKVQGLSVWALRSGLCSLNEDALTASFNELKGFIQGLLQGFRIVVLNKCGLPGRIMQKLE